MDFVSMLTGQSGMGQAGAKIGGALFPDTQGAFQTGALKAVTLQDKLLDARKKRDEEINRAGAKDKLVAAGVPVAQADLISTLMLGGLGSNYANTMMGEGRRQEQGFRQSAVDAAKASGDFTDYNAPLLGLENGPVETAKVQDGNILMGMFGDEPAIFPTEQGRARIESEQALAGQRRASGEAALIRANKPPAARSGRSGGADGDVLAQARERVAAGADPKTVADYLRRKGYPTVADKIYRAPKK
ncbi:hypothetical protein [Lysobacter olei]